LRGRRLPLKINLAEPELALVFFSASEWWS
jgi:hypothetical protein